MPSGVLLILSFRSQLKCYISWERLSHSPVQSQFSLSLWFSQCSPRSAKANSPGSLLGMPIPQALLQTFWMRNSWEFGLAVCDSTSPAKWAHGHSSLKTTAPSLKHFLPISEITCFICSFISCLPLLKSKNHDEGRNLFCLYHCYLPWTVHGIVRAQ